MQANSMQELKITTRNKTFRNPQHNRQNQVPEFASPYGSLCNLEVCASKHLFTHFGRFETFHTLMNVGKILAI